MKPSIEKWLLFAIGLGFGEAIRRLALWLHQLTLLDAMFLVTKIGIIGYIFYKGLELWAEITDMAEQADKLGAIGCRFTMYKMLPIFYWIVGLTMVMMMF